MSVKPYIQRMVEAGEARVDKLVGQILSNERFVSAVQGIVSKSLAAKGNLDKSLRSALNTMNLPTTADIEELRLRLDDLDRSLVELNAEVSRLGPAFVAAGVKAAGSGAAAKPKAAARTKPATAKKPAASAKSPRASAAKSAGKAAGSASAKKAPAKGPRKSKPES